MTRGRALAFAATAVTVIVLDQVTKALARSALALNDAVPVVDGVFWLTRVHNTGAAFGILRGQQWLLVGVATVVLAAITWVMFRVPLRSALVRTGLALVAGGTVGNLIDRVALGGVTDFFDLGWFPVFNVADIALDVGVVLIVVWLLFDHEHRAVHAETPVPRDLEHVAVAEDALTSEPSAGAGAGSDGKETSAP